jgi:hypothetical protein
VIWSIDTTIARVERIEGHRSRSTCARSARARPLADRPEKGDAQWIFAL